MKKNQLFKTRCTLLIAIAILYSCSLDDYGVANSTPASFLVSIGTLTENSATIFWTAAVDAFEASAGNEVEATAAVNKVEAAAAVKGVNAAAANQI